MLFRSLGPRLAADVVELAKEAFTSGLSVIAAIAAVLTAVLAVLAATMPRRASTE